MRYKVTIEEMLSKTIKVEAHSQQEAKQKVWQLYRSGQIILSSNEYITTNIYIDD